MSPQLPQPYYPAPLSNDTTAPIVKMAMGFWLFELFIVFSRFFDLIGTGLHIPSTVLCFLLLTSALSGTLFRGLNSKIGRLSLGMLVWVSITMLFSIWRSGSIPTYELFLSSLLGFIFVSGIPSSVRHVYQTLATLAITSFVSAVLSFYFGGYINGRLEMDRGTYADPNEFAMCLLMGIPFWMLIFVSSRSPVKKILSLLGLAPVFWAFFNTGSRGALIGLGALLALLLVQSSISKKIVILTVAGVGMLLISAFMPSYLKARYLTFFTPAAPSATSTVSEMQKLRSDIDSAEGRKNLLLKSIQMTVENPLFGVGPGNFPVAMFSEAKRNSGNYAWLVTHNSYTQISSETGIPGLVFLLMIISYAFVELNRIRKLTGPQGQFPRPDIFNCANFLRLSTISVVVCMFFLSVGFSPNIYLLAGVVVSLRRLVNLQLSAVQAVPAAQPAQQVILGSPLKYPQQPRFPVGGLQPVQAIRHPIQGKFRGSN
jgi:O-antigen ligase